MAEAVVVVALTTPAEGQGDAVRAALVAAIPRVHAEEGCEVYALHERPDGVLVMLERWSSEEALAAHAAGDALLELGTALQGRLAQPTEVTTMRPVPAGDPVKGVL